MKLPDDYKPYDIPKDALFRVMTGEYQLPEGWLTEPKEHKIIGETKDHYIIRIYESECHNRDDVNYGKKYLAVIGPHKCYFVKWLSTQLELF